MQLFYVPDCEKGDIVTLDKEESTHIVRVLRMKEMEEISLTDGKGNFFFADIVDANPNRCSVQIKKTIEEYGKRDFYIHLAIAPTKNINRIEWLLEKATEIGIDEITPLICEHSERKDVKNERLDKILVSAMKQSLKAYKPILNPMTKISQLISNAKEENKLICYCQGDDRQYIKDVCPKKSSYLILIGPEGDFSQKEVDLALANNFKTISLGEQRLRTETAALYSISNIHYLNQ
ncbi:MAG: 16S rRNA (uracil(1498)-N(3))-methyltransferase [Bacteroidales bacterium]|nr:16S rRNA (uracil(1498)-N(3))-methyltransferase [Candidatus Scybalousia scybalohippi]